MLGSKIMMAPIFKKGLTQRDVYFPPGHKYQHFFTKEVIDLSQESEGQTRTI